MEQAHRHLQHLLCRFLCCSRTETPQGSQLACAPGDVATRIHPITGRPSLFPTPLPAPPLVGLATSLPSLRKGRYGLTTFHKVDKDGLGALCSPVVLRVHDRVLGRPCTHYSAFWLKPLSIFGLSVLTTFIESSHVFTIPSIRSQLRLMLAETPSPHGSGYGYCVRGRLTARYLAAVPRRILSMEQQVWSIQLAKQSTLRPRVAAPIEQMASFDGQVEAERAMSA